jgi:hypothetical protein
MFESFEENLLGVQVGITHLQTPGIGGSSINAPFTVEMHQQF